MRLLLLILHFIANLYDASALSSDGVTLLSLSRHWISVPRVINLSWWATDLTPCSWVGVQCDHAHNVVSLNLAAHGIFGQLGPEIGHLNNLQTIMLLANGFSGNIPSELGNCSLLKYLDLSENSFSGQIPDSLKNLRNLQYMNFSFNLLTGEIPDSLVQIPHLQEVYLYNNSLSGPIPTNIGNMTELLRLYLCGNQLSGTIPPSIGNCSKLEALFLNENKLFGELPLEMTELKHLKNISLFDNQFSGIIPQCLGINSTLVKLDFVNNKFTGSIPPNLCFGKQLRVLHMSLNEFHGGIPPDIGRCATLTRLVLNENNLTGPLPSFEANLDLIYMDLRRNNINGTIPSSLGNCKSLTDVDLSMNKLIGLIPSELGYLVNLENLNLAQNNINGTIPSSLGNCTSLADIDLSMNKLTGLIPFELGHLVNLENLDLAQNNINGTIPSSLGNSTSLTDIDLSMNKLTGLIPFELGHLVNLGNLNLAQNNINGTIPSSLGNCTFLTDIDLSMNKLTGLTPSELGHIVYLENLNLAQNNINGTIPSSLGNCTSLTDIDLSMNKLTGLIPFELGHLVKLGNLNLSQNNINGTIPSSLGNCTFLTDIDLSMNKLTGLIPSELGHIVYLENLNLAQNNINGTIPSSLGNCTSLTDIDLSMNKLTGLIPFELGHLVKLGNLNLSQNNINGTIPSSLGNCTFLTDIDLSTNKLTGLIPSELGHIVYLENLNLAQNYLTGSLDILGELPLSELNISYNFFYGPVPKNLTRFLDFNPSLFLGNPGLCVSCSSSGFLSCGKPTYLKPCSFKSSHVKGIGKVAIVMIGLGSFMFTLFLWIGVLRFNLCRRTEEKEARCEDPSPSFLSHSSMGSLASKVMEATENLNDRYIIGRGADGIVYKAEFPSSPHIAAKKFIFARSKRGRLSMDREIETIGKIRHRNLVRYLGTWSERGYGLIFYEYIENGSLRDVLHEKDPLPTLEWGVRLKIAVGIARGLQYLHCECSPAILHRDVKPENILLDSDMEPVITDFGIALHVTPGSIPIRLTYIVGTVGYIASEIAEGIGPSKKSDVYSYGVVLIELITRKKVSDPFFHEKGTTLVRWVRSVWEETSDIERIVDSRLLCELSNLNVKIEISKMLLVALRCTERNPRRRPTMQNVFTYYSALFVAEKKKYTCVDHTVVKDYEVDYSISGSLSCTNATSLRWEHPNLSFLSHSSMGSLANKVMKATENLNDRYIIGRGAHGIVYIAEFPSSPNIAVKKVVFAGSERRRFSMDREIETIGKIRHRNLVRFLGAWSERDYGLIFYEYIENGSLHDVLHEKDPLPPLEWGVRQKIAVGVARGLQYLHCECSPAIVHRDIKPENLLLHSDMEPAISDFGIAQHVTQGSIPTRSTYIVGTAGYIAPEIVEGLQPSRKSDVYSYGVVLLELLTRKKVSDSCFHDKGTTMVRWVRSVWEETLDIERVVDSSLLCELSNLRVRNHISKVLQVALTCTDRDPHRRPAIEDVVVSLR